MVRSSTGIGRQMWPIFLLILVLHCVAILLFTRGFLLTRTELPFFSRCSDISQSPCFSSSSSQDASPFAPANRTLNQTDGDQRCWTKPPIDRLVIIVLDALRFDFVAPSAFFEETKPWMDKLEVLQKLASTRGSSSWIFKAIADPPTTSLQRLKFIFISFIIIIIVLYELVQPRNSVHQAIIPGLPDDLASRCLARVSHGYHGLLEAVSKRWRDVIRSSDYSSYKAREGWCGNRLFVLTEGPKNQWVAYDPEADRWHPLPKISRAHSEWQHYGFSCVSVFSRFLVIGGSYAPHDLGFPHQRPLVTNDVMQFDPFKKHWSRLASMRTPRSHFACSVVSGKVLVAGGRTSSCTRGLALAEVYDPLNDKWEDLPPMPNPQMDCLGLTYKGNLYVLSDQVGLPDQNTSEVFNPSDGTWCTVEDIWPFSRAMQFAVQVMDDDKVFIVVDWGESSIKSRDTEKGEWYTVGSVPLVVLPNHSRLLEAFGYGFAALRHELYVLGGKVLKWEESGGGRFDIIKLGSVRVCDPLVLPLKWREIRPMSARGSVLGCASLEEESSI